jgi:hypothetical protein
MGEIFSSSNGSGLLWAVDENVAGRRMIFGRLIVSAVVEGVTDGFTLSASGRVDGPAGSCMKLTCSGMGLLCHFTRELQAELPI